MHGRFAVEFRRERLLHQIFAFDDARQRRLDDRVGALVGGDVGKAKLVVQLLLSDVVRTDMSDDLPDHGLRLLLLAASGKKRRGDSAHPIAAMRQRRREIGVTCSKTVLLKLQAAGDIPDYGPSRNVTN